MNLQKQAVSINFLKGLDTKTDPWQVPMGNFLALDNMIFTTGQRLTKRNGYGYLVALPESATFLTTFNQNLTAIGSTLQALSSSTNQWITKGTLQPAMLSVLPLIRSNTNQSQLDTAIAPNGLICTVYTDQTPTSLSTPRYMYAVANSTTGQNIVEPTVIPVGSGTVTGSPRVFVLGNYFIIIFTNDISGAYHLQYIAVSTNNPSLVTTNADIASSYVPSTRLSWDGVVYGSNLYIAYDTTSGGQSIAIKYLTATLILSSAITYTNSGKVTATIMSMCVDTTNPSSPVIWASYYNSGTSTGYAVAVNSTLGKILTTPAEIITTGTIDNLATVASGGVLTVFYEVANTYGYDSSLPTNYISTVTCTQSGTVGSPSVLVRSVGLASKAFIVNGEYYVLAAYQSELQSTYFLINGLGEVVSKLAYANGGGYCSAGLPSVTINGNVAQIGYLFKDFITSANTSQTVSITKSGIYSQTGLNLVNFTIGTSNVVPVEIAQTLNLSGGFLWEYDGYIPVEQNFFLWADDVEGTPANTGGSMPPQEYQYKVVYTWTNNQGNIEYSAPSVPLIVDMSTNNPAFVQPTPLTPVGVFTEGTTTMTVSSATGLAIGQYVIDQSTPASILAGTYITKISGTTITVNQPFAGTSSADNLTIVDTCMVTLNIPTLRLTYKTANPVKIEIFRWSTTQEEFFQITSIEMPLINNTTIDYVTYVDTQADNQILGNSLIYTTGGVIEDIGAPSFNALTLFDDRVWGIDAEDPNLLWYSKQVIENTPVEMSDLFTIYVAPSIASQGSTGNMRCIAPMDDKLIIFKANALYYINGTGPDNTGANSQYSEPLFITSVVGSTNQQSIVFMPDGLMFQSDKGIWLLGRGMGVSYIGAPVESYTRTATVQSAVAIPETTQVRFTLSSGLTLMYDYYYQQWGTFSGVPAISSTLYQDYHTYLNAQGQIFQETPNVYLDGSNPVLMSFTTSWINLAGLQGYQRAYFFYMLGQYMSPHYLQYSIAYDYNEAPSQASLITPNNYSAPYGDISPYGQESPYGGLGDKEQWRVFLTKQRCQSFQLTMQEVFDASLGVSAGAGLTISGLNLIVAVARSFRAIGTSTSVGGNATSRGQN
jgi:hypothetical protein